MKVIGAFLDKLQATEIVLVASKNEYGQHFAVALKMFANENNKFRVARQYFIQDEVDDHNTIHHIGSAIETVLQKIKKDGFRIIFLATESSTAKQIIQMAGSEEFEMTGGSYIWMLSDSAMGALALTL